MKYALWIVSGLLAALFLFAGAMKLVMPADSTAETSASSLSGYSLSGIDMQPWVGKRVQVIGSFAPATSPAAATPGASGAATASGLREFRVQTVQPASGPCPK